MSNLPQHVRVRIEQDIAAGRTNAQITRAHLVSGNLINKIRVDLATLDAAARLEPDPRVTQ